MTDFLHILAILIGCFPKKYVFAQDVFEVDQLDSFVACL